MSLLALMPGSARTARILKKLTRGGGGGSTHCLQLSFHSGSLFKVPGEGHVGVLQRLARGDSELAESAAEMGASVAGAWSGEGGCTDVRNVLLSSGSGGVPLWVILIGLVPAD